MSLNVTKWMEYQCTCRILSHWWSLATAVGGQCRCRETTAAALWAEHESKGFRNPSEYKALSVTTPDGLKTKGPNVPDLDWSLIFSSKVEKDHSWPIGSSGYQIRAEETGLQNDMSIYVQFMPSLCPLRVVLVVLRRLTPGFSRKPCCSKP